MNRGVVILEHRTFSRKQSLKRRIKRICENASIMVVCDPTPQDKEMPQSTGRYYPPYTHHHRTPFHVSWLEPGSQHEMHLSVFARRTRHVVREKCK
ncbi:hypothetical protein TNCV_3626321 [Trichonephila clavipes]|nr:hypothetical protein TNCV_3626321 [Trichonephila clavipes]